MIGRPILQLLSSALSSPSGSQHEMITSLSSLHFGSWSVSQSSQHPGPGSSTVTMSLPPCMEDGEEERGVVTGTCNHLFTAYRKFRYLDSKVKSRSK